MASPPSRFRRGDGPLLVAAAVLSVTTLAGSVAALAHYSPDDAIGPLSEWVPGTATSLALIVVLMQDRRRRREEADGAVRWQAERVHYWLEQRSKGDERMTYAVVSNMSDQPVYDPYLVFEDDEAGKWASISLDVIPPHCERHEVEAFSERDLGHTFGSGFKFVDGSGERIWLRDEKGPLRGPFNEAEYGAIRSEMAERRRSHSQVDSSGQPGPQPS